MQTSSWLEARSSGSVSIPTWLPQTRGTPEKATIPPPLRVEKGHIRTEQGDDVIAHYYVITQATLYSNAIVNRPGTLLLIS